MGNIQVNKGAILSPNEKGILEYSLRVQFDTKHNEASDRAININIIKLAIKLSLRKDFVNEMIDDFNSEYNRNFNHI